MLEEGIAMPQSLKAIYENGVLRPLERVHLEEHQKVTLTIMEGDLAQAGSRSRSKESCYDLAARRGIIGLVKNAPSDLSTNPSHFDGFGYK
jgi:predicted DNA-binding antitoxin AbrB/MazE fold protein